MAALPPDREVAIDYIDGIEALEAGDFKRAVASFTRALEAENENADYQRARCVANTLAEEFPTAIADLQRALKLRPQDREARLWLAAASRMSGNAAAGAQFFTHGGDVPAEYASLVYNDMAMDYFSSRQGWVRDRATRKTVQVHELVKMRFPETARAYAQRHKATGPVPSAAVLSRMKASVDRDDWAAAFKDLQALRRQSPDDPMLRGYWATCLLGLGNALKAREEFTRTLCVRALWPDGYLGRAQAAAILGDSRRAKSDLETATLLGAKIGAVKQKTDQALAAHHVPEDALDRFARSVEADAPIEPLTEYALAVHRWANMRRHRYDEAYQDRIWVMSDAIRAGPKDPDRHERLARFLYNSHIVPEVWNGPRGGGEQLRRQSRNERQQELQRALEHCDSALKLNNRHPNAIATKGWVLYTLGKSAEAETLAHLGLGIERKNVRLLSLKSQLLIDTAVGLTAQATALRQGRTEVSTERRADGVYEVRRHYPPSAAQLAQAAALEAQAAECRKQAQQLTREAERVKMETIPALFKEADRALARDDAKSTRRLLEQAYSYDPDAPGSPLRLAAVCQRLKDSHGQKVFTLLAEPMRHTPAADELKVAWDHIQRTAWQSATEALRRAAEIDAADARVPAYRSVVEINRSNVHAADRQRQGALALEEARVRLMGTSFLNRNADQVLLELDEIGLTMILRLEQGNAGLKAGQNDKATQAFAINLALEERMPKEQLFEAIPSAMLPNPAVEANTVAEAPTLASLVAWSRLGNARALLALGRVQEAQPLYRAIRSTLANWPATSKNRETMHAVDAWARLGLARAAFASKDYETAFRLLMSGEGWPWKLPPELDQQRRALSEKVVEARKRSREDGSDSQSVLSGLRTAIRRLEQQRRGTEAQLRRPRLSVEERTQLERELKELDEQIADKQSAAQNSGDPAEHRQQLPSDNARERRLQ